VPSAETGVITGETLSDRYVIEREFGRGGMASVFLARDLRLGKNVAIKFPRRELFESVEARERFEREVRSLTELDHRAIVKVLDVGEHGDRPFVVMQFLPGGTLADRLQKTQRRLPSPMAIVGWVTDLAAALDFSHAHGVIHRDVKPSNVLFDAAGNAYLSDFGIARAIGADTTHPTNWGSSSGTPLYMGPEVTDAEPLGPAYDQYALGVMVYQALTGRLPHEAETGLQLVLKRAREAPRPIHELQSELSDAVAAVVMRAIERRPEARFPSCRLFAEAFRRACGSGPRSEPAALPVASVAAVAAVAEPPAAKPAEIPPTDVESAREPAPEVVRHPEVVRQLEPEPAPASFVEPSPPRRRPARWFVGGAVVVLALAAWWGVHRWQGGRSNRTTPVVAAATAEARRREALDALIRRAPAVPEFTAGAAGYERSRSFLRARWNWETTLGELYTDVLESRELQEWKATADLIEADVAEADGVRLRLEESGTVRTEERRATIHGELSPDRLDLLLIAATDGVSAIVSPLEGGRFAASFELPPGPDQALVNFSRLDGTVLATVEIRVPEPAAPPAPSTAPEVATPTPEPEPRIDAAFTPISEPGASRRVWRHDKSGLRFVEVEVPRSAVGSLSSSDRSGTQGDASDSTSLVLLVSETECTNDAWHRWRADDRRAGEMGDLPVVNVGGSDVVAFCAEMGLELPREAEWRFVAQAGEELDPATAIEQLGEVAWFRDNSGSERHPVRQRKPNGLGLYDAQGNVWELCLRDDERWEEVVAGAGLAPVVRPYLGGSCNCSGERCLIANTEFAQDGPGAARGFRPIFRPGGSR